MSFLREFTRFSGTIQIFKDKFRNLAIKRMIDKIIEDSDFSVRMTLIRVVCRKNNSFEHFRQRNIKGPCPALVRSLLLAELNLGFCCRIVRDMR